MKFARQIELKVKGKNYIVSLHEMNDKTPYYCAYVILKGKFIKDHMDLNYCTYNQEDCFGIDTIHSHNLGQTLEERYYDAIRQITELIKSYVEYEDYLSPLLNGLYITGKNEDKEEAEKIKQTIRRLIKEN